MADEEAFNGAAEDRVREIMEVAIDEFGGLGEMARRHQLAVLPAVIEAAWVLVLREECEASDQEIADRLGITRGAVSSVFESPFTDAMPRIRYAGHDDAQDPSHTEPEWTGLPTTTRLDPEYLAGAAAKFAYSVVRRRAGQTPPETYGNAGHGAREPGR